MCGGRCASPGGTPTRRPARRRRDRLLVRLPGLPEHRHDPRPHAGDRRCRCRSCPTAGRRCSRASSRSACWRTSICAPRRPAGSAPSADRSLSKAVAGAQYADSHRGIDPAITGEPPEERVPPTRRRLSRTGRVRPVTAGDERATGLRAGRQAGWYRGAPSPRPCTMMDRARKERHGYPGRSSPDANRSRAARGADPRRSGSATTPSRPRSTTGRPGRTAATSSSSTTGRRSPTGCPHYGHLLTGYVKDARPALPDHARPAGRAPLRLGLPRAAGRDARPRRSSGSPAGARSLDVRHRRVQRRLPHARCCATPRSGSATSPARPAGSTSTTTTRPWTSPTWRASCGRSRQLWDKGLIYEGYRVLPYCWRCETPLSNFETAAWTTSYRDRQDPAVTVAFELRRRPTGCSAWTTTPWTLPSNLALAVGPDIDYARRWSSTAQRYVLAEARAGGATRAELGATPRARVGTVTGADLVGRALPAAVPLLRRPPPTPSRSSAADFVDDRGRHRRRAHGARVRRGRPESRARAAGIAGRAARSTTGPASPTEVARLRRHARLRRQPAHHRAP